MAEPDVSTPASNEPPEDFAQYEQWRKNGNELPQEQEKPAEAAEEKPAAETAPESAPEEKEQEEGEEGEEPTSKKGLQKRFSKLTQKIRDLEARLALPPQDNQGVASPKVEQKAAEEGKPKAEDFDTYDEYIEKLTDWRVEQREKTRAIEDAHRQTVERWNSRLEQARKDHDDFDEIVGSDIKISQTMRTVILDSEKGTEVAYYLGKHPKESERIAGLPPLAAAREIGRIEAELSRPAPPPKLSSAPPPAIPVSPKGSSGPSIHDENLPYADYERLRRAQLRRK